MTDEQLDRLPALAGAELDFDDIRHGSPGTDYWRGWNDGINKAEEYLRENGAWPDAAVREWDELRDLLLVTAHDMHDYAIVAQEDPLHPAVTWNICTDERCAALRAALHRKDGAS